MSCIALVWFGSFNVPRLGENARCTRNLPGRHSGNAMDRIAKISLFKKQGYSCSPD
jgi:hypothetical protein